MCWAKVRRRMKIRSTFSSSTCEARSGGDPTLAASQTNAVLPRDASQAIAMIHLRGYNGRGGLLKGGEKGRLQFCLGKRCLEWLLGPCEAGGCGKGGGDSFEIEISAKCFVSDTSGVCVARGAGTRLRLKFDRSCQSG